MTNLVTFYLTANPLLQGLSNFQLPSNDKGGAVASRSTALMQKGPMRIH